MATLTTSLPALIFPHEADTLAFAATADFSLRLTVGDAVVMDVRLTPSSGGTTRVSDLAGLLRDALPLESEGAKMLSVALDGQEAARTLLLPCAIDAGPAESFVYDFFLSLATEKLTTPEATERLSFYTDGGETEATVSVLWQSADGRLLPTSQTVTAEGIGGGVAEVDVSPRRLTLPGGEAGCRPVRYTVTLGRRRFTFRFPPAGLSLCSPTEVRFLNSFGHRESFVFFGAVERELKPTYSAASVGGQERNYLIEAQPTWTARTPLIGTGARELLDEVATSRRLWRAADGRELTVTDCEVKAGNAWHEPASGSLSFREAGRGRSFAPQHRARTFDDTFDETYQ